MKKKYRKEKDKKQGDTIKCSVYYEGGETLRALRVRKKEHCDAIRLGQSSRSAIAEHIHEQWMPHEIDWQGMKPIDRARWKRERKIREAFHIPKRKPQLNRDGGV